MIHNQTNYSGIRIENTLSMSLRTGRGSWRVLWWLLLAAAGVFGSIYTFLSMFTPAYHAGILFLVTAGSWGVFSFTALCPKKFLPFKLTLAVIFVVLLWLLREAFFDGFVHMMNAVCKVIYHTDWDYFSASGNCDAAFAGTVFLCMMSAVIAYSVCYAVIRFQNVFLCLLPTFPFVELGFWFGIAPDHFLGSLLFAFWCAMTAVHLSNFGVSQDGTGKCSFLRRDNTFFPVSGMRFMVTEKIGMLVMTAVLIVCLLLELLLQCTGYERADKIKQLRTDARNFVENFSISDITDAFDFLRNKQQEEEPVHDDEISLGNLDARMFDHVAISELHFSKLPQSRLYLKYDTGHTYADNSWVPLAPEAYDNSIFEVFGLYEFHAQDFLGESMERYTRESVWMEVPQSSPILRECVPYAHAMDADLTYRYDYGYRSVLPGYLIYRNCDFEGLIMGTSPYENAEGYGMDEPTLTVELEKEGYLEFVYNNYLALPATTDMGRIREAYSPYLSTFDAETATPEEKLLVLQRMREKMCSESTYSLSPGKTPDDEDFAAYFLLDSHTGYCEHYATAGTILARMAGIPARYCQGYMVGFDKGVKQLDDGSYSVEVLDSYAHAWTEIYLDGIGWLPFEFTFSYFTEPELPPLPTETPVLPALPTEQETEPKPSTQPHTQDTSEASATEPAPSPTSPDKPESVSAGTVTAVVFLCVLAFAVVGGFVLAERLARNRRERSFRQPDTNASAWAAYRYLCRLLTHCGVFTNESNLAALAQNAQAHCGERLTRGDLPEAIRIGGKLRFSPHDITSEELTVLVQTARGLACGIDRSIGLKERLRLRFLQHLL